MSDPVPAIDVVYTWVNGEDPAYWDVVRRYASDPEDVNPERYRDAYELLRYSMRSLERFAPWVRNVYLFTCRPQVPAWLNAAHPRIRIVHHDEVMSPDILPTFNSNVIESHMHLIPNDSDWLLYLNDDWLLGAPTTREDFLTADGRIRVFGTLVGERTPFRVYEEKRRVFSIGFVEHAPVLIHKPFWAAAVASRPEETAATRRQRFRQPDNLRFDYLYRQYLLRAERDRIEVVTARRLLRFHRFHKITNDARRQRRKLARLRAMRPLHYCLNDDQRGDPNPEVVATVRSFLSEMYPEASSFEHLS